MLNPKPNNGASVPEKPAAGYPLPRIFYSPNPHFMGNTEQVGCMDADEYMVIISPVSCATSSSLGAAMTVSEAATKAATEAAWPN